MKSIIPRGNDKSECYLCHAAATSYRKMERHHCIHGADRKMADRNGLTVYLCHTCHKELHDHGVDDRYLQKVAQRAFEKKYSRDLWMSIFGRNYLWDEEE